MVKARERATRTVQKVVTDENRREQKTNGCNHKAITAWKTAQGSRIQKHARCGRENTGNDRNKQKRNHSMRSDTKHHYTKTRHRKNVMLQQKINTKRKSHSAWRRNNTWNAPIQIRSLKTELCNTENTKLTNNTHTRMRMRTERKRRCDYKEWTKHDKRNRKHIFPNRKAITKCKQKPDKGAQRSDASKAQNRN